MKEQTRQKIRDLGRKINKSSQKIMQQIKLQDKTDEEITSMVADQNAGIDEYNKIVVQSNIGHLIDKINASRYTNPIEYYSRKLIEIAKTQPMVYKTQGYTIVVTPSA